MKRIIAELSVDENILLGNDDDCFSDRINEEFGWLEQSGIALRTWREAKEDEHIEE